MKPYEVLAHTADVGLRFYGKDYEELLRHAALGLFELMTDVQTLHREKSAKQSDFTCSLQAENASELFLSWLRELLFQFATRRLVPTQIDFESLTEKRLQAHLQGPLFDPKRHEQRTEVKAVTYHAYKFEKRPDGYVAEVIFDI